MIVYADLLFLINSIVVFTVIGIVSAYKYVRISPLRRIFSALTGGMLAVFIYACNFITPVKFIVYLLSIFIICNVAFGGTIRKNINNIFIFLFVIFVMQSVLVLIVSLFENDVVLTLKNNIMYFNVSPILILLCFLITYPVVCILSEFMRVNKRNRIYNVTIINNGKSIKVKALFDSGNILKEPISKKDVIILEVEFAQKILYGDEKIIEIPYCTVSGNGIIKAFMPDVIFIDDTRFLERQYIAMTHNKLSDSGEYNALIGNVGGE